MSYDFRMDEFLDFFLMLGRLTEESVDRCFHEGGFNPRTLVVEVIPNKKGEGLHYLSEIKRSTRKKH